jgi:hypothetical protein
MMRMMEQTEMLRWGSRADTHFHVTAHKCRVYINRHHNTNLEADAVTSCMLICVWHVPNTGNCRIKSQHMDIHNAVSWPFNRFGQRVQHAIYRG